MYRQG